MTGGGPAGPRSRLVGCALVAALVCLLPPGCTPVPSAAGGVVAAPPHPGATNSDAPDLQTEGIFDYDWRVRGLDGEVRSVEGHRGEVLVLNVWATWCPPCVAELGSFERLEERLRGAGVAARLLLVSPEEIDRVREFVRIRDIGLDVVVEETRMPDTLGELVLPTTFVVDRQGRIVLRHRGAAEWAQPEVVRFLAELAR